MVTQREQSDEVRSEAGNLVLVVDADVGHGLWQRERMR